MYDKFFNSSRVRKQMILANTLFKCVMYDQHEVQIITCGTDRKIGYWECHDGSQIREVEGATTGSVNSMDISSDGNYFVTGGDDRLLKVWNGAILSPYQTILSFNDPQDWFFENIEGKGEDAGNQHFLLFPDCFLFLQKKFANVLNLNNSDSFFFFFSHHLTLSLTSPGFYVSAI